MRRLEPKTIIFYCLVIGGAFLVSYTVDQYYIAGRGYTFFFDILKL